MKLENLIFVKNASKDFLNFKMLYLQKFCIKIPSQYLKTFSITYILMPVNDCCLYSYVHVLKKRKIDLYTELVNLDTQPRMNETVFFSFVFVLIHSH